MAVKISICVNKKVGLPEFGSAGSHCDITLEADNSVLDNAEEFQRRVQKAYDLARQSVEEELAHHRPGSTVKQDTRPTTTPATEYRNSPPPERNSAPPDRRSDNPYPVSPKQLDFIGKLSKGIRGLSAQKLDEYCQRTFGNTCRQLSAKEASQLIDSLKDAKERKEGLA